MLDCGYRRPGQGEATVRWAGRTGKIKRARADIEVFDVKTAYLGRSHSVLVCQPNE
jgi:hypothetical protein